MRTREKSSAPLNDRIREMIISGAFAPGERLKEEALSKTFRVSRTPLRQALISLKAEGLLQSRPNAGFLVTPISRDEVSSLYPIVWTLEALALEDSVDLLRPSLSRLRQLNESFLKSRRSPEKSQGWDMAFHESLTALSTNQRLKEIIACEKQKILRYERLYMQDNEQIEESYADHGKIVHAIEKRDKTKAIEALVKNWQHGMWAILGKIQVKVENLRS